MAKLSNSISGIALLTGSALIAGSLFLAPKLVRADTAADLQADADKIVADLKTLATDKQQCRDLIPPARKAVKTAREKLEIDSPPQLLKLQQEEDKWAATMKAHNDGIDAVQQRARPEIDALEEKVKRGESRSKSDKAAAAQVKEDRAQLKAAQEKLEQDVHALQAQREADAKARDKALDAAREAKKAALKDDEDALRNAQLKLEEVLQWETRVEADKLALDADRKKLQADKDAASAS